MLLKSAVVGSPRPIKGQEIKAFIVLTPDIAATRKLADKIFTYCKAHLASYKVSRLLEFVAELPKTTSGKIRRIELRAAQEQQQALEATQPQEYYL